MAKAQVTKAATAAKAQNAVRAKAVKVRTSPQFQRPRTLRVKAKGKYAPKAIKSEGIVHANVVKVPVFTDAAMKQMERANTLTFMVDMKATKCQIKTALKKLHGLKVVRVNTLVTKRGTKKAYCKLDKATSALSAANTLGLI